MCASLLSLNVARNIFLVCHLCENCVCKIIFSRDPEKNTKNTHDDCGNDMTKVPSFNGANCESFCVSRIVWLLRVSLIRGACEPTI